MRFCIHNFETCKNCNREKCLLVSLDIRKLPTNEDSQHDEQNQSTEDVADDRKRMRPLSGRSDASDPALSADGHADQDEQDNIHADVREQRRLLTGHTDKDNRGCKLGKPDDGGCDDGWLRDGFHCSYSFLSL
jgi:hypothetical protein